MQEVWKDIPDYEGLYQVSNLGRIKSLEKKDKWDRIYEEKILKPHKQHPKKGNQYVSIYLSKNGIKKRFFIHRLVMMCFSEQYDEKLQVNHKDGNKENNKLINLEWCTQSENIKHSYKVLGRKKPIGLKGVVGYANKTSKAVIQYDKFGNIVNKYGSANQASLITGIDYSTIKQVCRGVGKTAGGYIWKYEYERN